MRESGLQRDEKNLLDFWNNIINEKNKTRLEFYGRAVNPNSNIHQLYQNLEEKK